MQALIQYFNGSLEELRLVQWATRHQAIRLSTIVLVFVFVSSVLLGLLDFVLAEALQVLLSLSTGI